MTFSFFWFFATKEGCHFDDKRFGGDGTFDLVWSALGAEEERFSLDEGGGGDNVEAREELLMLAISSMEALNSNGVLE